MTPGAVERWAMRPRATIRRATRRGLVAALIVPLTVLPASACGGSSGGATYSPKASRASLTAAGWHVVTGKGMKPISGGRQVGYLIATSPSGPQIDIQFLESPDRAKNELAAVRRSDPRFKGAVIGSALVLSHNAMGESAVGRAIIGQLKKLLK
jgi:hypothetical protein